MNHSTVVPTGARTFLVNHGQQGVGGVRDDGGRDTGDDAGGEGDAHLGHVAPFGGVAADGVADLLRSDTLSNHNNVEAPPTQPSIVTTDFKRRGVDDPKAGGHAWFENAPPPLSKNLRFCSGFDGLHSGVS